MKELVGTRHVVLQKYVGELSQHRQLVRSKKQPTYFAIEGREAAAELGDVTETDPYSIRHIGYIGFNKLTGALSASARLYPNNYPSVS
jgi:hypothetical protein